MRAATMSARAGQAVGSGAGDPATPANPAIDFGRWMSDCGAVAQLGERRPCKAEVVGSSPISSTIRRGVRWLQEARGSFKT